MSLQFVIFLLLFRQGLTDKVTHADTTTDPKENIDAKVFDITVEEVKNNVTLNDDSRRHVTPYNDSLYHFEMFENFELTREVFANETKLVKSLRDLRSILANRNSEVLKSDGVQKQKEDILDFTFDFPSKMDFDGAVKGLLLLQDTYAFDLGALTKGKLISR